MGTVWRNGAVTAVAAAAFVCSGTGARGEGGWHLLREDGRSACFMERDDPDVSDTGTRSVVLKRVFKEGPRRRDATPGAGELDCMGNPLPPRQSHIMAYSLDTVEFLCRDGLYRFAEIAIYDPDRVVMLRFRPDDRFVPVPPESHLDAARSRACR